MTGKKGMTGKGLGGKRAGAGRKPKARAYVMADTRDSPPVYHRVMVIGGRDRYPSIEITRRDGTSIHLHRDKTNER